MNIIEAKIIQCKFYNDHDANVAECNELLDDRFLPIKTCEERTDCLRKCKYFDADDNRGEICLADRKMVDMYGEEWDYPLCKDNNCYFKQLLAEQAENKKLNYIIDKQDVDLNNEMQINLVLKAKNKKLVEALTNIETILGEDSYSRTNGSELMRLYKGNYVAIEPEIERVDITNNAIHKVFGLVNQALNEINNDSKEVKDN